MAARREHEQHRPGPRLSGEKARQGEIILKTPARRAVFIGGLVVAALAGLLLLLYQAAP